MNKCEICDKMFFDHSDLSSHLKNHQATKVTGRCNVCGRFVSKANLKNHLSTSHPSYSEAEKINNSKECNQCGKTFSVFSNLKRHQQSVHEKLKPFSCNYCESISFSRKDRLTEHIRKLHTKRNFNCNTCGEMFIIEHELTNHITIHSKE